MRDDQPTTPEDLSRTYAAIVGDEAQNLLNGEASQGEEAESTPPPALRIIESLLFVGGAPLTASRARDILRGLSQEQFDEAIAQLNADYRRQGRPYALQSQGAGWALALKPRFRHVVEKLYGGVREARLSQAAIDVLSIVAYRQPATKPDVDNLRGADSAALLRQLVRRGLVQIIPIPGGKPREVAYTTTLRFLETFGLHSLDELPKTHDLQQI